MLREENRFRVLEIRILRKTFGPKREEVVGGWKILHNEKLQNLHVSLNIIRVIMLKTKVKLALYLTKHHAVKMHCGGGGIAPHNLIARQR
jgi:hypothetical protein